MFSIGYIYTLTFQLSLTDRNLFFKNFENCFSILINFDIRSSFFLNFDDSEKVSFKAIFGTEYLFILLQEIVTNFLLNQSKSYIYLLFLFIFDQLNVLNEIPQVMFLKNYFSSGNRCTK